MAAKGTAMSAAVHKLFDPDREEIERLASSIDRDTSRLLELMSRQYEREIIGECLFWLALAQLRLQTIQEDFRERTNERS